jgi:hypothetical protein
MRYFVLALILGLAACGVDGEPERPERAAGAPGLAITGTASIGITGSN